MCILFRFQFIPQISLMWETITYDVGAGIDQISSVFALITAQPGGSTVTIRNWLIVACVE